MEKHIVFLEIWEKAVYATKTFNATGIEMPT